jgi:rhamnulokinase
MNRTGRFVAFDFGASSGRAVVGEVSKDRLDIREIHRFENNPVEIGGRIYWNFGTLFGELLQGLRTYKSEYGPVADGVGVDTWGCDFGQLDRNGEILRMPRHYRDSRTEGSFEIIERDFGRQALYRRTGIQFLVFNTLNQLIAMRRCGDPTLDMTEALLFMPDLFHYCLTGQKASEFTMASISQIYNVHERQWDMEVCEAFDIPTDILQPIVQPGTVLAELEPAIARETGVSGPVILPATHDTASAAVAIPSEGEGIAFISSGTWSIVGLELAGPSVGDEALGMGFSNSGGAFGRTIFVKNVMGLWIIQQCKDDWARRGRRLSFDDIVDASREARKPDFFIDPDGERFLNPRSMITEIMKAIPARRLHGMREDDVGAVARLVFESLAMKYRYIIEGLKKATGAEVNTVHVVGGGAKNSLLNQLTADAMGLRVIAGPVEATAIGNISIQAIGAGMLDSLASARNLIRNSFPVTEYSPRGEKGREAKYERFLEMSGLPLGT